VDSQLKAFVDLETKPLSLRSGGHSKSDRPQFAAEPSLFGRSVRFSIEEDGRVSAWAAPGASPDERKVAKLLHNSMYLHGLQFILNGTDTHHFVKAGDPTLDLVAVGILASGSTAESLNPPPLMGLIGTGTVETRSPERRMLLPGVGANLTVRGSSVSSAEGQQSKYMDVELRRGTLAIRLRYGSNVPDERARLLTEAKRRAWSGAWERERRAIRSGESTRWSQTEKLDLLAGRNPQSLEPLYLLPPESFPELADSSRNVQIVRKVA